MIPRALVIAALAATVSAQGPAWVALAPTTSPGTRRAGAMAFDAVSNKLIAYGGLSVAPSGILNETWAFGPPPAAGNWTLLTVGGSPPPRWGHKMVRNTANNRLITFGGRSPTLGAFASDTWEFTGLLNGGNWAQVATGPGPSARYLYGLAFDEVRNVAILFGGSNAVATFDDTWEYNGTGWTEISSTNAPSPREDMVLVYDRTMNRTVLFGGYDPVADEVFGDTWLYDGAEWTLHIEPPPPPATSIPTPRFSASAVYDSIRKRVVMFGGFDGAVKNDTYEFSGNAWLPIAATGSLPPNATEAYSGFDPVRRKFLLFGGFGTVFTNQTWELNAPATGPGQTGIFGSFSPGCNIAGTAPGISGTTPTIGQTLGITYGPDLEPGIAIAVIGTSNQFSGALPLPFDLGLLAIAPGNCPLLVAADFIDFQVVTGDTVTFNLPIPNSTTLINFVIYTQGLCIDATSLYTTPGARAVIGN